MPDPVPTENPETATPPEKPMSPLQRLKARQMAQASNRAAKEKRADPSADKTQGGGSQATPKQMRSSASKQGS